MPTVIPFRDMLIKPTGRLHVIFPRTGFNRAIGFQDFWKIIEGLDCVIVNTQSERETEEGGRIQAELEGALYFFDIPLDLMGAYLQPKSGAKRPSLLRGLKQNLEATGRFFDVQIEQQGKPLLFDKEDLAFKVSQRNEAILEHEHPKKNSGNNPPPSC